MNRVFVVSPSCAAALALVAMLAGCASIENSLSGDKLDYRSQAGKTAPLEVPPDLTQLARDGRYLPQSGSVSASAMQQGAAAAALPGGTPTVAPSALAEYRIERQGTQRWLSSTLPPEQVWPQVRSFWLERGFTLALDNAQLGLLETEWAENRAKLPQDFVRGMIGRVFDALFSTGERDKFRTRIERTAAGSEIYITHRGMVEVYTSERKESTTWQPRPADPELEAEFLSRLMVRLGTKEEVARAAAAMPSAPVGPARARALAAQPGAALEVDEAFDRAWRRVGLALDRGGFTVEDRDRSAGLYFVRYVDPKLAGQDEPNFISRLFGGGKGEATVQRYRLSVKASGSKTQVSVLNSQGVADNGDNAKAIIARLVDELR